MKRPDLHQRVTDAIISELEKGTAPWHRPWQFLMPVSGATSQPYHGINVLLLAMRNAPDPRWLTFNQAKRLNHHVKKGARGEKVYFYRIHEKTREDIDPLTNEVVETTVRFPILREYTVFNGSDIEGLAPLQFTNSLTSSSDSEKNSNWEHAAGEALTRLGINVRHGGNMARYLRDRDEIQMPFREMFEDSTSYYAVLFHEIAHATGHQNRLNRTFGTVFGSEDYAKEELVAEIASAMMGARLGLDIRLADHASYVGSWLKALQNDKRLIFRCSAKAEKATNLALGILPALSTEPEIDRTSAPRSSLDEIGIFDFDDGYQTQNVVSVWRKPTPPSSPRASHDALDMV